MPGIARILDLFQRPVDWRIEEVIKVDQTTEDDVFLELTEYVVTDAIREFFERILREYREMPNRPSEGMAIWISGFFGSGKSSFAKILGYVLSGRQVRGRDAGSIFCDRLGPSGDQVRALLGIIRAQIPTTAVIFDISTDRGVRSGSERITEVIYKALLRHLDYATDMDLAELEIALEADGRLAEFERRYEERYGRRWRQRRSLVAVSINEASAVMQELDPRTYPLADSWARARRNSDISPNLLAERTLDLTRRRLGDQTVLFVIDEVGQYVSRSADKMLDLQGVVQALGRVGKGKVWIAVTSQERLDEVVDSLEGTRVELARVQDRFPSQLRVDLAPSDISEVTSKRVLTKKPECESVLQAMYERSQGTLTSHSRPVTSSRRITLDERAFVELYPFLPYQVDLIIDIVAGLRNQPGASRQTGGANRTIIKLAQQVLINPHTQLGAHAVGDLVTLDMIYDLVEGNVGYERRRDIDEIDAQFRDRPLLTKVAKAICLLQFMRGISRTAESLAAVLYPAVGSDALTREVQTALASLLEAQKIREGEAGYELLSVQGKTWEEERRGIAARGTDYTRLKKELATDLLKDLRPYRYRNVRNFAPAVAIEGEAAPKGGEIPLQVQLVDAGADLARACATAQDHSRQGKGAVTWVAPMGEAAYAGLLELHRSREMIARHERRVTSAEEGQLLNDEKNRQAKILQGLRNTFSATFLAGKLYHEGREYDARGLGGDVSAAVTALFADVVPGSTGASSSAPSPSKATRYGNC